MKENIIKEKFFSFSLDIINLYKELIEQKEYVISKQLLRSGTSIGANIEEASAAQSKKILSQKWLLQVKKQEKQNIGYCYCKRVN